jgi:hypothetical protein
MTHKASTKTPTPVCDRIRASRNRRLAASGIQPHFMLGKMTGLESLMRRMRGGDYCGPRASQTGSQIGNSMSSHVKFRNVLGANTEGLRTIFKELQ